MAFSYQNRKGNTFYLHTKNVELANGNKRDIYFFSKEQKEGVLDKVPDGWEVSETDNGLPVLRRAGKEGGGKGK